MTAFDPLRAQREIVAGLVDMHRVFSTRAKDAERALSEAEADYNAFAKMERFAADMVRDARAELKALEQEAELAASR